MAYKIVEEPKFTRQIAKLEKLLPRISQFREGLHFTLERNPFSWGIPVPRQSQWIYGAYFIGRSDSIGKFPSFDVVYRITDDTVYLLHITAIKF